MTDTTIVQPFVEIIRVLAAKAVTARDAYVAATKKPDTSFKAVIEANADSPLVKAFLANEEKAQAQIKKIQDALKTARAALVTQVTGEKTSVLSEDEVKALRQEFLDTQKKITKTRDSVLALLDGDEDTLTTLLDGIDIPKGVGGSGTRKSPEGEIVRLRISEGFYNGESLEDTNGKVSLTSLSLKSKVDGALIRKALAEAANVSDIRDIPKGSSVTFSVTVGDVVHNFAITVAEKPSKNSQATVTSEVAK